MIPILNKRGDPIDGQFKTTLADSILPEYDKDLAITIADENGNDMLIPVWRFIEMFVRITDKKGNVLAFELLDAQVDFYKQLCEQKRQNLPMRANILKARQLGFSTFIAAVIFVLTILVPNQNASIIADKSDHATNLFNKYKFYYNNLPEWFKKRLPLLKSNAKELAVDYGRGRTSSVRIMVQGENAGRSATCQYLHLSEVAFWQDIENTTTSILQTVDDTNPNSIIAYETTANGINYYKTIWDIDMAGQTCYKPLFYPWWMDKRYVSKMVDFEKEEWETKLQQKLNLTDEQMAWYHGEYRKLHNNLPKLRQEYPSTPTEAFIVSGNSKFNMELVLERKDEISRNNPLKKQGSFYFTKSVSQDGNRIEISNIKWTNYQFGAVKIFEEPIDGHPYVVCNDPAMGGEDYFATQVFDNHTGHQVAVYHKNKCDADEVAYQMYCLAIYYNNALVTGETNTTSYLLKLIYKCGYRFIYQDQDVEVIGGRYADKFGYKTKQTNRTYMIDLFAEHFRDDPKCINDYETICEIENLQVVKMDSGKEKLAAASGCHDDLVMSACGFELCRNAQTTLVKESNRSSYKKTLAELEMDLERKQQKQYQQRKVYQVW